MSDQFVPLDLMRMMLGAGDRASLLFYLEIVIRTSVMFGWTVVLARLVGNGSVGQVGPFELVIVIAVGSAAGDPMFYPEVPLAHGLLVITVVILLHRFTQMLAARGGRAARYLEGQPAMIVRDGVVLEAALGHGTLTRGELFAMLRAEGVRNTGEVEWAWFEPTGRLSVFRYAGGAARAGEGTFPEP
ncbi:MAG: DUF421 domain-containing protein [Hyphomicrobiaceae bacterium]